MWKTQFSQLIIEMIASDQHHKMICMLLSKVGGAGGVDVVARLREVLPKWVVQVYIISFNTHISALGLR